MRPEDIHTYLHAAWAARKFGYIARRRQNKNGVYMLMHVTQEKRDRICYTLMTPTALMNLAKTLLRTEGNLNKVTNR